MATLNQFAHFTGIVITEFWKDFITGSVINKSLPISYSETSAQYNIFSVDLPLVSTCTIYKAGSFVQTDPDYSQAQNDLDRAEFEAVFKNFANKKIHSTFAGTGSVAPASASLVGGKSDSNLLQPINVDTSGALRIQADALTGSVAPLRAIQIGGKTSNGNLEALTINSGSLNITGSMRITEKVNAILVDVSGTQMAVSGNVSYVSGTKGILAAGIDSSQTIQFVNVDSSGSIGIQLSKTVLSQSGVAYLSALGSQTIIFNTKNVRNAMLCIVATSGTINTAQIYKSPLGTLYSLDSNETSVLQSRLSTNSDAFVAYENVAFEKLKIVLGSTLGVTASYEIGGR